MEPKKNTAQTDPAKKNSKSPSRNEEMDAPHKIVETAQQADIIPENESGESKPVDKDANSSTQDKEISETLGLDDNELETKEDDVVN